MESLGSNEKKYGFQTPLATKHAFNGWADDSGNTPTDGLHDTYVKLATTVADVNLLAVYHDYSAAKGSADHGSEIDLKPSMSFVKNYSAGVNYAASSKGILKPITDKACLCLEPKFKFWKKSNPA